MDRRKQFGTFLLAGTTWLAGMQSAEAAFVPFRVDQITIEGEQRISEETIRSYLPIETGRQITPELAKKILKALYATGFFKTVTLAQDGHRLIIKVVERPTIASIEIRGNRLIKTDALKEALASLGLKKGQLFNVMRLDQVALELKKRYQDQGYYGAVVQIHRKPLPRNRVALTIDIREGEPASIGRITFTGNKVYSDERLRRLLSIEPGDQYAREALQADLDKIRDFYLNRGFAEFQIRSTQVRLSPDKSRVYVTVNLSEGPAYRIGEVRLQGELLLPRETLEPLIEVKAGDYFSREKVLSTIEALRRKYSENAYANVRIQPVPDLDPKKRIVHLRFVVQPGQRVYVRHVVIKGNTRTRDHVIRREVRQLEKAPFNRELIQLSKRRLERLGFFKSVRIAPRPVAPDLVDVVVEVEEQPTGSFTAAIGYSQVDGAQFSLGLSERNFLGSGNEADIRISTSASRKNVNITLVNPYFTENGVSLGVGLFWNELNAKELDIADYTVNTLGGRVFSTIPLSEESRFSYGLTVKQDELVCNTSFNECNNYVSTYGQRHLFPILNAGWRYNSTNAFYFPTEGSRLELSVDVAPPTDKNVGFAKVYAGAKKFTPLSDAVTFKSSLNLAYGEGLGDLKDLPFYERFYAGGIRSVRGFEANSLSERYDLATDGTDVPKGGDFRVNGTLAVITPFPFIEDSTNMRVSFFYDFGYAFRNVDAFRAEDLRGSAGIMLNWLTPVGPLSFSFAKPVQYKTGDKFQEFQFSLGIPF